MCDWLGVYVCQYAWLCECVRVLASVIGWVCMGVSMCDWVSVYVCQYVWLGERVCVSVCVIAGVRVM